MKCRSAGSEERVSLSPTTMQHLLARVRATFMRLKREVPSYMQSSGQIRDGKICHTMAIRKPGLTKKANRLLGVRADEA